MNKSKDIYEEVDRIEQERDDLKSENERFERAHEQQLRQLRILGEERDILKTALERSKHKRKIAARSARDNADGRRHAEAERDALKAEAQRLRSERDMFSESYGLATAERDALKLELNAEKFNHRKDNEYLVQERDSIRAAVEGMRAEAQRQADNMPNGAYRQGLMFLVKLAREALARLEEK